MLRAELLELIANGESSGVEFKRDDLDSRDLAKELAAFANLDGGVVLLGVEGDGSISGIQRASLAAWVMQACRDKIRPELNPYFEVVRDVSPGRDVAVVRVQAGYTVHAVWHNQHLTYCMRVGSTSREASSQELERLFQQRGSLRSEIRPVSGTSVNDLDRRRLVDYFVRVRGQEVPDAEDGSGWEALLTNTEVLADEGACTVAGLLLFGTRPNRFLPQAGIDAATFPGTEKDYTNVEPIRGPLVALFQGEGARATLVEPGLVEQALAYVERQAGTVSRLDQGRRIDLPAYPAEAVREAVVNALVHRDYLLTGTTVELALYADRLEVVSPGRLPNAITPERMRTGCRAARNQLLKDVLRDYGYMEHMGLGVPRKIVRGMREHNGTEPDLVEAGEQLMVRMWRGGAAR